MKKTGKVKEPFWKRKTLEAMTRAEWDSLCAGCGRCCVVKYENPDTLKIEYTKWACRHLNLKTCRCRCYLTRKKRMPECVNLFHCAPGVLAWLPTSCAYRLLMDGHDLPSWHPLVSGKADSTCRAGMSVRGHVVAEPVYDYE